ncbi:MAG: 2-oxoacid:acceptor oxidoreductase family protein, partial [Oscillospiraceae bacterium]
KDIIEALSKTARTIAFDAMGEAKKLGNIKCMNVILLGSAVKRMNLEEINWHQIIKDNVKPQFAELNIKAFDLGQSLVK